MASQDKGRPLPKFGEWDVNNPASAEGFTVIFNKARDEKKTSGTTGSLVSPRRNDNAYNRNENYQRPSKEGCSFSTDSYRGVDKQIPRKWFCCG